MFVLQTVKNGVYLKIHLMYLGMIIVILEIWKKKLKTLQNCIRVIKLYFYPRLKLEKRLKKKR